VRRLHHVLGRSRGRSRSGNKSENVLNNIHFDHTVMIKAFQHFNKCYINTLSLQNYLFQEKYLLQGANFCWSSGPPTTSWQSLGLNNIPNIEASKL
jgi:hypothetical protein